MKYKKKKYLYWKYEDIRFLILINNFRVKEQIQKNFSFKFKKIKESKKPYWFTKDSICGYAIDKNKIKSEYSNFPIITKSLDNFQKRNNYIFNSIIESKALISRQLFLSGSACT